MNFVVSNENDSQWCKRSYKCVCVCEFYSEFSFQSDSFLQRKNQRFAVWFLCVDDDIHIYVCQHDMHCCILCFAMIAWKNVRRVYFALLHIIMCVWVLFFFMRRWSCSIYGIVETNSAYNARVGMALALAWISWKTHHIMRFGPIFITNVLKRSARIKNTHSKYYWKTLAQIWIKEWTVMCTEYTLCVCSSKRGIKIHRNFHRKPA